VRHTTVIASVASTVFSVVFKERQAFRATLFAFRIINQQGVGFLVWHYELRTWKNVLRKLVLRIAFWEGRRWEKNGLYCIILEI
jgi:hypothetical protein